jgi:hypothetical protein
MRSENEDKTMIRRRISRGLKFLLFVPVAILAISLVCLVVMGLWNWLMPAIFGLQAITFWQALGLLILSRLLLGRFHGRGHSNHWRHRMRQRLDHMTPEEREKFFAGVRGRCRPFEAPPAENPAAHSTA